MSSTLHPLHADLHRSLKQALQYGPRTGQHLVGELGISRSVLSRAIRTAPFKIITYRVKGTRSPFYALLRALPLEVNASQRIFRILSSGKIVPFADVEFLAGGGTVEHTETSCFYKGLPPYMSVAAPSGFLGRQIAHSVSLEHTFPTNIKDWNNDHRIAYLFKFGLNLPGNLVFGDIALQLEFGLSNLTPLAAEDKRVAYTAIAKQLKDPPCYSSVGGEQPKFLSLLQDTGHVIVKFAKIGSRMAKLLPLEYLALRSLANVGVPTAKTEILTFGEFVFLEVARFDRVAQTGRVGMLSAGVVADELCGLRDSWSQFAARCFEAGYLSKEDVLHVNVIAAFSELIGNTDRHFENISILIGDDGKYRGIAPAYDILPMRYAAIGGGVDPELLPIEPRVGSIGADPAVWTLAARAADEFWCAVETGNINVHIPNSFRELAHRNRQVAHAFTTQLLPDIECSRLSDTFIFPCP